MLVIHFKHSAFIDYVPIYTVLQQLFLRQLCTSRIQAACSIALCAFNVQAGEVRVATAANFTAPMKLIASYFERDTGHTAKLSFGATGQLFAHISHGAPFDVLIAADESTPQQLIAIGLGVADSSFTYAIGTLVLWSANPTLINNSSQILYSGKFGKIAIASPTLAPYGLAAMQVIKQLGVTSMVTPKLVEGASIGQTFQFVASGNASLGFVALSQVRSNGVIQNGSAWMVPANLHAPIRQDAVLLTAGKDNQAAKAFLTYLRSDTAAAVIRHFGYGL
jgi:molybdate transport system substrate-binding protein